MHAILEEGYQLALSPWWLEETVRGRHEKRLAARTDKRNRFEQIEALNIYNNALVANAVEGALPLGTTERIHQSIIEQLNELGWKGDFLNEDLVEAARRVQERTCENAERLTRTPAEMIRRWLEGLARPTRRI